jgi:iron complex transport system substrate-binding protein
MRVVCLQPSVTAILAAIGRVDDIVACTRYCADVCEEVRNPGRVIVADSWSARASEILATQPDLVIAAVPYQEQSVIEILRAGVRFLGLAPRRMQDIYADIALIAGALGAEEAGKEAIAGMKRQIETVRRQSADPSRRKASRPRVFCEEWGKPLIASQPWVAELVDAAGGEFVGEPGKQILPDSVRAADPDVLIASWCGAGDRVPLRKTVAARGWQAMRAVEQQRVYCIPDEFLNTPAPTLMRGLQALASAIHPDRFPQAPGLRWIAEEPELPAGHSRGA